MGWGGERGVSFSPCYEAKNEDTPSATETTHSSPVAERSPPPTYLQHRASAGQSNKAIRLQSLHLHHSDD